MKIKELSDLVAKRLKGSPSGSVSVFVPMGESNGKNWGLKLFECEKNRDRVFAIQKKFEGHGFAPELGEKINLSHGKMKFGYMTEQIELVVPHDFEAMEEFHDKYPDEILDELVGVMADVVGVTLLDMHIENWGLKDGELMPLDFGAYRDENEKFHYHHA